MAKKFTLASAKSFIKKNRANLLIKKTSDFDGMTDCVQTDYNAKFVPVVASRYDCENNLGIAGVWFVGGSRDGFVPMYAVDSEEVIGFECWNCCGSFFLKKA